VEIGSFVRRPQASPLACCLLPVARWHGWRLVAADTTTLRLPGLPETVADFGLHGDRWGGATPMAGAIGLYDAHWSGFDLTATSPDHAKLSSRLGIAHTNRHGGNGIAQLNGIGSVTCPGRKLPYFLVV